MGPVDCIIVGFPGTAIKGDMVPALKELVDNDTINIIDLLLVKKDADGTVSWVELDELPRDQGGVFDEVDGDIGDLLNDEDAAKAGELLEPGSSAAMLVYENAWATRLGKAIVDAGAQFVVRTAIPADAVEAALAATEPVAD